MENGRSSSHKYQRKQYSLFFIGDERLFYEAFVYLKDTNVQSETLSVPVDPINKSVSSILLATAKESQKNRYGFPLGDSKMLATDKIIFRKRNISSV